MFKGFKTIAFNTVMAIVLVVRIFNPEAELPDEVAVEAAVVSFDQGFQAVLVIGNLILRGFTNSPIFNKE